MPRQSKNLQPSLFEDEAPRVILAAAPMGDLAALVKPCCARSRPPWQTWRAAMSKVTTEHLARGAYVYIRQSTADQLTHNHESRRRQYGLVDRACQLGWTTVEVIDDALGRSGGGIARPGFERLLAAICEARVGAVLAIEVSRLARNGRDW